MAIGKKDGGLIAGGAALGFLGGLFFGMAAMHENNHSEAYPKEPAAVVAPQPEKPIEIYDKPEPKPEKPVEFYTDPESLRLRYGTDKEFKKKVTVEIDGEPYRLRIKLDGEPVLLPQEKE